MPKRNKKRRNELKTVSPEKWETVERLIDMACRDVKSGPRSGTYIIVDDADMEHLKKGNTLRYRFDDKKVLYIAYAK